MRSALAVLCAFTLSACARPLPRADAPALIVPPDQPLAMVIEKAVERASTEKSGDHALWPGFDPLSVPLAINDGHRTYLFRHPAPPAPFLPADDLGPDVQAMDGRSENVTANTNSEIGGVPTATLLLDPARPHGSAEELAAVAIHEAFHVYQRKHHPGWIGNEADLFTYPTDSADLLALRRQETQALRKALQAEDPQRRSCWARTAITLRGQRYAQMEPAFADYERGTELNEGLATYVQMRVTGRMTVDLPAAEFKPGAIRQRAYATGPALAVLLDRADPGWIASFESNDKQTLDEALSQAVGKASGCALESAFVSTTQVQARQDVAALIIEKKQLLSDFQAQAGWRLIFQAEKGSPLWPQGFDPLNVERLEKAKILHTRFIKLGNDDGQIEVLNAKSLTQGAGAHPLFNGVDRLEVAGLQKPQVVSTGNAVEVNAPGVSGKFKSAWVRTSGTAITVTLRK